MAKENEIHVKFAGIEKAPGGPLSILYIPDQRQVLLPGVRYKIVLDGLSYDESKPKELLGRQAGKGGRRR